jgi:hypothetical protein
VRLDRILCERDGLSARHTLHVFGSVARFWGAYRLASRENRISATAIMR